MATFTLDQTIAAPPETVFDVLTDHRAYPSITPLRTAKLEREGDPPPNGVGAVRVLGLAGPPLREEVVEYDPPTRFVYRLLSGLPVRDHVGEVVLTDSGDGRTRMVYRVTTTPTIPLVGGAVLPLLRRGVGQLAKGVAKEAERRAKSVAVK